MDSSLCSSVPDPEMWTIQGTLEWHTPTVRTENQSGDLRGSGLPSGGYQRFESAYLQLVNLADTKLYDSTQFFEFGGSIYDLSFMDIDKIHLFSSTLGWHSLKSEGRGSNEERLTVVPRHPETRKGIVIDEMIRGVENKHRSGDSRIGKPFKLLLNP
ncbi:hypothetical protein BC332_32742 [Capsicum chinense]|nr:hypothetical protein BC332_32742 [Capsicum chinense]